jgi:hypothetical protein
MEGNLVVPNRVSLPKEAPEIHPKGQRQVNQNWRTKCKKRSIDEINSYFGCGNTELFSYFSAYTKRKLLYIIL